MSRRRISAEHKDADLVLFIHEERDNDSNRRLVT
jgi:hypothetical protein